MNELDQFKKNAGLNESEFDTHDRRARAAKLTNLNQWQAEKLIFEWVKTNVIQSNEFSNLLELVNEKRTT